MHLHIQIRGTPPLNSDPRFRIVNTASNQLPAGPDSVSFKDYQDQTHISTERARQLVQVLFS